MYVLSVRRHVSQTFLPGLKRVTTVLKYTSVDLTMFRDSKSGRQVGMLGPGNAPSSGSPTSSFGSLKNP